MSIQSSMEKYARKILSTVDKAIETGIAGVEVATALNEAACELVKFAVTTVEAQSIFSNCQRLRDALKEHQETKKATEAEVEKAIVSAGFAPDLEEEDENAEDFIPKAEDDDEEPSPALLKSLKSLLSDDDDEEHLD